MLKIPRKISEKVSLALAVIFMVALILAAVCLPQLVDFLLSWPAAVGPRDTVSVMEYTFVLSAAYGLVAICAVADILLFSLLRRVRKGLVFTPESIGLVRGVSWCVIGLGVLFAPLGYYFQVSVVMAFLCVFLGLCLRVVKNVLEEATAIKEENDLTV